MKQIEMKSRDYQKEEEQKRTRAYALRDLMRKELGEKCKQCDNCLSLSFHHPNGRNWEPNKKNLLQRMRLYYRDFLQDKLELLCVSCNRKDGAINRNFYKEVKHGNKTNQKTD